MPVSALRQMRTFRFDISGPRPFQHVDGTQLPSSDAAWNEAVRFVRDIEDALEPGDSWTLDVSEDGTPIFRIAIVTMDMRKHSRQS